MKDVFVYSLQSTLASIVTTPECKQLGVRIARGGRYFVERIDHSVELKTFYEKKRWSRITNHSLKR